MEEKVISIPISLEFAKSNNISDNLVKARIQVLHEGLNYNESIFTQESIENAQPTIANIPVLTFIRRNESNEAEDFGGHEVKQSLKSENGKMVLHSTYLEQPIGVVPETNNYHYETINEENWVVVDGYIWKNYSNEAYEILKKAKTKGVSMEIKVLEGETDLKTGFYLIKSFEYLGITVLGDDITPAMGEDAKIQMYSKQNKQEYFTMVENLSKELKYSLQKENEVESLKIKETFAKEEDEEKDIEKNSCEDNKEKSEKNSCKDEDDSSADKKNAVDNLDVQEEVKQIEEAEDMMSTDDKKKKKSEKNEVDCMDEDEEEACLSKKDFAKKDTSSNNLSINYLIEEITSQLDNITEVVQVWWQEAPATVPQYYLVDLLVDKNTVIVTDFENTGFYGIPYIINGDEVQLQVADIVPYVSIWKQKEISETNTKNFSSKKSALKKLLKGGEEVYNNLKEQYQKAEKENKSLREFKLEIDKQTRFVEIDNKINEFNFSEEEVKDLRELAYSEKISMEELEKELYALEGRKVFEKRNKFSLNKKQKLEYKINQKPNEANASKYGSASIYFNK